MTWTPDLIPTWDATPRIAEGFSPQLSFEPLAIGPGERHLNYLYISTKKF